MLVVDDEVGMLAICERALVAVGCQVESVRDGASAVARIGEGFDVVVTEDCCCRRSSRRSVCPHPCRRYRCPSGNTVVSITLRITKLERTPLTPSMRVILLSRNSW
jgi:CheY-like chemotaxis protein